MKELMNQAIVTGGLTITKVNGKPEAVRFDKGYQVSKTGINFNDLDEALKHLERLINELEEGDEWYIGLWSTVPVQLTKTLSMEWNQDSTLYIEPSYHIENREEAIKFGVYYKQESIYDWENDDLIWLRYCKITGKYITEGFYNEDNGAYYKDEKALRQDFTEEEQKQGFEDGWLYWTSWEE
jgi:hypothetical protein